MIERERRRLKRAFRVALLAASGPAVMMACGGGDDASDAPRDGGTDATVVTADAGKDASPTSPADAAKPADASKPKVAADATPPLDAFAASGCYLGAIELDSGPEAAALGLDTCLLSYGCGLPSGLAAAGCSVQLLEEDGGLLPTSGYSIWVIEEAGCTNDAFTPTDAGACTLAVYPCPAGGGRRTAGLAKATCCARPNRRPLSRAGAYLAAMAYEEAASVAAFARMRSELLGMRAPQALVRGAARAERDETRHARIMASLARANGAEPVNARVRSVGKRSALAVAVENATEGCVRETYGALALAWQAAHAGSGELRQAFARIARDEARHAALSWALAGWLDTKLDAKGRARVQRAKARAIARLVRELREPPKPLAHEAGLPTVTEASALLASMARELGITAAPPTKKAARRRSPRS